MIIQMCIILDKDNLEIFFVADYLYTCTIWLIISKMWLTFSVVVRFRDERELTKECHSFKYFVQNKSSTRGSSKVLVVLLSYLVQFCRLWPLSHSFLKWLRWVLCLSYSVQGMANIISDLKFFDCSKLVPWI